MAEGGDFGYDDPDLDRKFDNYDDEDENEVTRDGYDSERGKEYRICRICRLYGLRKITSNRF